MEQWHRLQILITQKQKQWLKAKSFTTDKSIGQVIRELITDAMEQRGDGKHGTTAEM